MNKLKRQLINVASDEAKKHGAFIIWLDRNKHYRFKVCKEGKCSIVGFSTTPRTGDNALAWVRQDVRKAIASLL